MEESLGRRSNKLIAEFVDGFAVGWHMAIKDTFRNELDIKYLPRKKQKQTHYEWSQGPYFSFSEGQIIYDTPKGYERWDSALKYIKKACQVIEAKPNIPSRNELTHGSKYFAANGFVKFLLLKPNEDRTHLEGFICYNLSQNDFVDFLRTGKIS
jgi:hypothetical protein